NEEGLKETASQIGTLGRKVSAIRCDVANSDDVNHLEQMVDNTFGRVDILINDPYTLARFKPEDLSLDDWNRLLQVNGTGYFLCAQAAGRRMIKQGWGGSIINISSIAGSSALGRGNFAYSVSKGAVNQFTRELAVEWAQHKIRVNAIQPAQMRT